jgi:hypothetical protein
MWVQWWAPADPPGADEDPDDDVPGDADEAGLEDVDVVCAVVAVALVPVADASATPVPPAPSPAATTPVMISRRARLPVLETIVGSPFSRLPPRIATGSSSGISLRGRAARWP